MHHRAETTALAQAVGAASAAAEGAGALSVVDDAIPVSVAVTKANAAGRVATEAGIRVAAEVRVLPTQIAVRLPARLGRGDRRGLCGRATDCGRIAWCAPKAVVRSAAMLSMTENSAIDTAEAAVDAAIRLAVAAEDSVTRTAAEPVFATLAVVLAIAVIEEFVTAQRSAQVAFQGGEAFVGIADIVFRVMTVRYRRSHVFATGRIVVGWRQPGYRVKLGVGL